MRYTIGQLAEIIDGDRGKNYPKQNEFHDVGYCLFLNTGNVTSDGFSFLDNQFITEDKDKQLRKGKLQRGDIVYTTRGTVGNAAFYSDTVPYDNIRINSGMVILRCDNSIVDTRFLYQILKSSYYRPYFKKYCTGSAQPQLPIKNMSTIEIEIPAIDIQYRIADILTAYDNLIENNQKQIKLLEEAAQRLYKEWFVDLRFPGYENTPIVDGVPEGWSWGTVDTLIEYHDKKRKPLSSMERSEFQGNYKYYGAAGVLDHVKEFLFDGIYLLLGEDGTVISDDGFPVLQYVNGKFWVNNHAHVLTGKDCYSTEYIYMMFKNIKVSDIVTGVAQPKISQARLSAKIILIPETKLVLDYSEIIKPYMLKVLALQEQNEHLVEARDRLLPKLMSGEIEV